MYQLCTLDLGEHISTYLLPFLTLPHQLSHSVLKVSVILILCLFTDSNMLSFLGSSSSPESQPLRPTVKHDPSAWGPFCFLRVLFNFPNQQSLFFINPQFHLVPSEIYYLLQNQRGNTTKYFLPNIVFPP